MGDFVGVMVTGSLVGDSVGDFVGAAVPVGDSVGDFVGAAVGRAVGDFVGILVTGCLVGDSVDRKSVVGKECRSRWSPYHYKK